MTKHQLEMDYARVFRDVYVAKRVPIDAYVRALAAAVYAREGAVLVGLSAAALHGTKWLDGEEAEVVRSARFHPPKGMRTRQYTLKPDEVRSVAGVRVTTPERTAFDLGRTLPRDRAVIVLDALCNATGLRPEDVEVFAERYPGTRGVARLRRVLALVDGGAESPPETLTRLLLIDAGLPRPESQVHVFDCGGRFVARCDLGWPRWRVIVEYDGEQHWTDRRQRARDIERLARLDELGWVVVRVGAELLNDRPAEAVRRVREKLLAAGASL